MIHKYLYDIWFTFSELPHLEFIYIYILYIYGMTLISLYIYLKRIYNTFCSIVRQKLTILYILYSLIKYLNIDYLHICPECDGIKYITRVLHSFPGQSININVIGSLYISPSHTFSNLEQLRVSHTLILH